MCRKLQSQTENIAAEIQNKINEIRDSLQIAEGCIMDLVDTYYQTPVNEWTGIRNTKGVE